MRTCKDCLHYTVCQWDDGHIFTGDCGYFTDRSEWVHLPCAEGTRVYMIENDTGVCYDCSSYDCFNECCEYKNVDSPLIAKLPVCNRQCLEVVVSDTNTDFILHHIEDFGKMIFFTREAAEEALERMKDK